MKEIYQQTVKDKIQRQNQEFSREGLRVLAFTYREIPDFVIGAMTMIGFLTGYHQNGALLGSTYAFGTLCLARLFHGLNCKSDHPVIFTKVFFNNKWLQGAFVLGAVLITAVLMIPGLHRVFNVETLNLIQLGCVYLYAFASLLIIQLIKCIRMNFIAEKHS